MPGGYSEQKSAPKSLISSDQIAPGAIELRHLSAALFSEIQKIALHPHTGVGSKRIKISDLEGAFGTGGFYGYSSDGTKRYHITLNTSGAFVITEG